MFEDNEEIEAAKKAKERQQELDDLRLVMSNPNGRRVIWRILSESGLYQNPFVPGAPDATSYNCGRQSQGQWLLSEVMIAAKDYFLAMQKENGDVG